MSEHDAGSQNGSSDSSNESLNGSWVKLDASYKNGSEHPFSVHNGEMESLLAEAVAEEKTVSLPATSGQGSTCETKSETKSRIPPSKASNDESWIENWASRIEPLPPKKWRLTYPPRKDSKIMERNQRISAVESKRDFFQVNFYIVIPALLVTHLVAFGIGFYIGRHSSHGTVAV